MISALILAAGEGKRMGKLKQLLPLGRSTVLEKTIENVRASRVNETIVVLGYRAKEIIPTISTMDVKIVVNPHYRDGMSTSIIYGLHAVAEQTDAIMVVLADQPFVDSSVINQILEGFVDHDKGIIVPVYEGKRGHPVVISLKYRSELLCLKGDIGARKIVSCHPEDIHLVNVDSRSIVVDIDTEEEYKLQR